MRRLTCMSCKVYSGRSVTLCGAVEGLYDLVGCKASWLDSTLRGRLISIVLQTEVLRNGDVAGLG